MLTRAGFSFWTAFTACRGAAPSLWGEGSTLGGEGQSHSRERVQEKPAVWMNSARLHHKEVIEAFTICLTGDICFLQARQRAACRQMRYSRSSLPGSGPIPAAAFDTATTLCVGRGNRSRSKGK